MGDFKVGDRVDCGDKGKGAVAFVGTTEFSAGIWVGVVLDEKKGKNDGSVKGVSYFQCEANYGVFLKPESIKKDSESKLPKPRSSIARPSTAGIRKPSATPSASARGSRLQTPKMSPAVSTERLARQSISRKSSVASSIDSTFAQPELPKETRSGVSKIAKPPSSTRMDSFIEDEKREASEAPSGNSNESKSVKDMARRIDAETPINMSFQSQDSFIAEVNQTESFHLQSLKTEVSDLTDKLNSLRAKRKDDEAKLAEFERLKYNYQHLLEHRSSATEALQAERRRAEDAEKRVSDLEEQIHSLEQTDLTSQLELITLDKELAEERVENLQMELSEKSTRLEELETELEMLKSEMAGQTSTAGDGELAGNSVQIRELNVQLQRCQAVIVKMRDMVNASNLEQRAAQQSLEDFKKEYERVKADFEKQRTELSGTKTIIDDLHEQVDAALGSTRMVDHLTSRNLELDDQLKSAVAEKEHYYELYQLTEDIANANREAELEARAECDRFQVMLSEKELQLQQINSTITNYEKVVQQFRQKVSDLNNDLVGYKDQIHILETRLAERGQNGSQGAAAQFSISRDFSKTVAAELDALELKYLTEQQKFLKGFLPDNFGSAGGDFDCLLLTVFFPRMAEKAELLIRLLCEKYPDVPDGITRDHITLSHKGEQWAHVRRFHYQLLRVQGVMRRFESVTKTCTAESLQRLASQRTEITSHERVLNNYFDLLKQNRFDENTSVENLEHCANTLNHTFILYCSASEFDTCNALNDYFKQYKAGLAWARFNCRRLELFLLPDELENNDLVVFLESLSETAQQVESVVNKASRLVPTERSLDWNHDLQDLIYSAAGQLEKVSKILQDSASLAVSQLSTNDVQGFCVQELKEFLQSIVEKRSEGSRNVDEALREISSTLETMKGSVDELAFKLEKKELEKPLPEPRNTTPLQDRAMQRRQYAIDVESLRWQIKKKDEEYVKVYRMAKDNDDLIVTLRIQLERERKRRQELDKHESANIDSDRLQETIAEARKQYDREIADLKQRLEEAERIREKAKDDLEAERRGRVNSSLLIMDPKNRTAPFLEGGTSDVEEKQARLWAEDKVRRLQAELNLRTVAGFKPLKLPDRVCGPQTLKSRNKENIDLQIESYVAETDILDMQYKKLTAPGVEKNNVLYKKSVVEHNNRVADLRYRMKAWWIQLFPGTPIPYSLRAEQMEVVDQREQESDFKTTWKAALSDLQEIQKEREQVQKEALAFFACCPAAAS